MTRTITRTFPLFAVLFAFMLSSCSDSMYSVKRHYGRSMYVKAEQQKKEPQTKSVEPQTRAKDNIVGVPGLGSKRLGSVDAKPSAKKLDGQFAKAFHRVNNSKIATATTRTVKRFVRDAPQFVQTVNITRPETQDETTSAVFTILIIIGVILLIAGFLSLVLDLVGAGGWLGLILAGLLIVLIAYLLFANS